MTFSRYSRTRVYGLGERYGTSRYIPIIRDGIDEGRLRYEETVLDESMRIDILAGNHYEDGRLWWVIAAASGIGWALQVPPGTLIRVPNLDDVNDLLG
jgi:hypothetical protein